MSPLRRSSGKPGSARSQMQLKEVRDGILILPGNRYRAVLATSSVNFELQSDAEQDALIDSFQQFLNSLTKPIQILIRVRELDIDRYLDDLTETHADETEAIYQGQLANYSEFIRNLVSGNKILSRKFYLVLPYDADKSVDFAFVKEQLGLEQEILAKSLGKLGMTARPLSSLEVLDLFYNFYQPQQAKTQPLVKELVRHADAFAL